jgi:hypothetical protein
VKKKGYLLGLIVSALAFTGGCAMGPKVEFLKGDNKIDVVIGGEHFTSYLYQDDLTKPILYPLRTPSGIAVNRGYPLAQVGGESTDHPHHAGVFFTYDKVNDNGFWNNTTSPPQVKHVRVVETKGGGGKGRLSAVMHWVGKDGHVLLEETRDMVFLAGPDEYAVDFSIDLAARDTKIVFGDTKEGMFAIRLADWLRERGGSGRYLSSNGDETEKNVWGKRARWVRLQGERDGEIVGIAILNHPKSVNYPTYWHARGYGLFSANPLGQFAFQKGHKLENPQPLNLALEPGEAAHFRFRIIIYEGERTQEQLEERFRAFVKPARR